MRRLLGLATALWIALAAIAIAQESTPSSALSLNAGSVQESEPVARVTTHLHVQPDKMETDADKSLVRVADYVGILLHYAKVTVTRVTHSERPLTFRETKQEEGDESADYLLLLTVKLSDLRGAFTLPKGVTFNFEAYDRSGKSLWDDHIGVTCGAIYPKKKCLEIGLGHLGEVLPLYVSSLRTDPPGSIHNFSGIPSIESFTPTHAPVGAKVIIKGWGLAEASKVTFGGVPAGFTIDSPRQITATVPEGAKTGKVVVECAGGAAKKATFTIP